MFKLCFVAFFICVAAQDDKTYTFDQGELKLAKCIFKQLVNVEYKFKLTIVSRDVAYFAAKRFHGKSMSSHSFTGRLRRFYYDLRKGRLKNNVQKDQLSEQLRAGLKRALIFCANIPTAEIEKPEKVSSQSEESITFSWYYQILSKCIENHLKLTGRQEFQLKDGTTESIADSTAKRFLGKSLSIKDFHRRYYYYFRHLRERKLVDDFNTGKLSREIELPIRQALEDCAEGKHPLVAVPTFENEPPGMAHFLDYILVKWPNDLRHMIQSKNGRAVLRKYVNDALTALMSELNIYQNNTQLFRVALQSFWNSRAQRLYNGNSVGLPYIVHRYTSNYPTPHMLQSDIEKFINRSNIDFKERNSEISESHRHEILNLRKLDYSHSNDMTSSEYYFENQLNQFYRVLFFIIEVCTKGICIDEYDVYDETLPADLIPEHIQAIVYNDGLYREYLLNKRSLFKRLMDNDHTWNVIAENLLDGPGVSEENLLLLMLSVPSTSGIQTRSESSTTKKTISTSTQPLKRKDNVWKNENGKCFPKRAKMTTISGSYSLDENLVIGNLNEGTSLATEENYNYSVTDLTDEDLSNEFCTLLKQEKHEGHNFYGIVYSNDGTGPLSHEDLLVIQDMCCFSDN